MAFCSNEYILHWNLQQMKYLTLLILLTVLTSFTRCEKLNPKTCSEWREKVKNSARIGGFAPQCNEEDETKFKTLQCHTSAYYCFCADEVEGIPTSIDSFKPPSNANLLAKKVEECNKKNKEYQEAPREYLYKLDELRKLHGK